jgi:cell division control protein 24
MPSHYALAVWWRGDDDLEFFTLRCRTEEQLKQWETQINRLIAEVAQRRASERGASRLALHMQNSTHSPLSARQTSTTHYHDKTLSATSDVYLVGNAPNGRHNHRISPYSSDEQVAILSQNGLHGSGPQGYPPHDGFDFEPDDDEFEDYPPTSTYGSSGRGTPVGGRRGNAFSMPPERDAVSGYDRPRAQTEDTNGRVMAQWRTNGLPPPPMALPNGLPPSVRSIVSPSGHTSDPSFGSSVRPLRSQFSSTKLSSGYDGGDPRSRTPGPSLGQPAGNRSRSVSQPSAYIGKMGPAPPLPAWSNRPGTVSSNNKRGSGSSQSTGESSDYSPNSSSPITPFGSSESSLGGVGIRPSRSQNFDNAINDGTHLHFHPPVKVKVHFHEDIFVIQVPRSTEYNDLVEKVGRKIRLCGPRRDDGPLRVKYRDEDGDMVSLGSTEDVQMAFEHYRPGGQVTLFVT